MQIGKTWDYDAATNTWVTVDNVNDAWFVAFIHTLQSDPAQHLTYADFGVSALDALQNNTMPTLDITRTVQQFSPYFAQLLVTPESAIDNGERTNNEVSTGIITVGKAKSVATSKATSTIDVLINAPETIGNPTIRHGISLDKSAV